MNFTPNIKALASQLEEKILILTKKKQNIHSDDFTEDLMTLLVLFFKVGNGLLFKQEIERDFFFIITFLSLFGCILFSEALAVSSKVKTHLKIVRECIQLFFLFKKKPFTFFTV